MTCWFSSISLHTVFDCYPFTHAHLRDLMFLGCSLRTALSCLYFCLCISWEVFGWLLCLAASPSPPPAFCCCFVGERFRQWKFWICAMYVLSSSLIPLLRSDWSFSLHGGGNYEGEKTPEIKAEKSSASWPLRELLMRVVELIWWMCWG